MAQTGRPRALDQVKRGQVCALVAAGCGLTSAARYVNCSVNTIRREALRNEDFRHELRASEVRAQLTPLKSLQKAAESNWRAAAWLLERANPDQFERRRTPGCRPADLQHVVESLIELAVEEIDDDKHRDRVCRRLMAGAAGAVRTITSFERARLTPSVGPFDLPTNVEDASMNAFLAELEENRLSALRDLRRNPQKPRKCA